MDTALPAASDTRPSGLSRDPRTGWALLAVALPVGGWLLWEIHRTIGLSAPRFWELLRAERVFDVAMLDFVLTAAWAMLVLIERARGRSRWLWLVLVVFFAIPSVGIALFLLIDRGGRKGPVGTSPGDRSVRPDGG